MPINTKFLKCRTVEDNYFCEYVVTSYISLIANVKEDLARLFSYKFDENADSSYRNMTDDEVFENAINMNFLNYNIILPTIPTIMMANVDFINEHDAVKYIDVTDYIIDKIKKDSDINAIKDFVTSHSDLEIVDKYCTDNSRKNIFFCL
jgi:hypothetical protein